MYEGRAAIIIGSGSASYEIIKHLALRLPLIFVPRWANNLCQPIAIRDVIKYLVGCLEEPATEGRSFDIGGEDVLSYKDMLRTTAGLTHERRVEDLRLRRRLLLRAEMKLPGKAWLALVIDEEDNDRRRLDIIAHFEGKGIFGAAYWFAFQPFHFIIFKDLLKQIEARS